MTDPQLFAPLYDFSCIEKAQQDLIIAYPTSQFVRPADEDDPLREQWKPPTGMIPFYTPTQALVLQECRPRVGILETNFSEFPSARILDADDVYRASAWKAVVKYAIITDCNYKLHRQLRALVTAILPQMQPIESNVGATGLNAFLPLHEVGLFSMQSGDTSITPQKGFYMSTLSVNLSFSVRATAWPGGTLTN